MAKPDYKIPASLDNNYLDMEIAIQKDGAGLKPLPVRVILLWLVGIFAWFYLILNNGSFMHEAGFGIKLGFTIVYFILIMFLTKRDRMNKMQIEYVNAFLNYIPKSNRNVITRRSANAAPFYAIAGIERIDPKTGMVVYTDETYAYWYKVVGTASNLLFAEDRNAIIDRVNDFYKKVDSDCELIFFTTKEPQNVSRQLAHLQMNYNKMTFRDKDMNDIVREQYLQLREVVGKRYRSMHQYFILKGDSEESLAALNNVLISECENSSRMISYCEPLYQEDIQRVLKLIYSKGED